MGGRVSLRFGLAIVGGMAIVLVTWGLLRETSIGADEKGGTVTGGQWPEGVTKEILVCLDNLDTGKFEFDAYLPVVEYKGYWRRYLKYMPDLQGEHVRQYRFLFIDANDKVIYEYPFTVEFNDFYAMDEAHARVVDEVNYPIGFSEWLPFPERMRKLVFMEGDTVLAEKVRSEHGPVLSLGEPKVQADDKVRIPWSVSDADDRELTMDIKFLDVDGEHLVAHNLRLVLEPEAHTEGHFDGHFVGCGSVKVLPKFIEFESRQFQGGENCKLLIEVCDGLNTERLLSEPFNITLHIPDAVISSPQDGQTFREDEEAVLVVSLKEPGAEGYGYQDKHGVWRWKGNYQIRWTSDKDGELGQGYYVDVSGLSAGQHTITVVVKGLAEIAGKDSVKINVLPATFPEYWISAEDVTLTVDYERANWPTFLRVKVRGRNISEERQFGVFVKYKGHDERHALWGGMGGDPQKDTSVVVDGTVPWPFTEAGEYEAEVTLRWTGEPSVRQRDNTVIKTFQWDGPADREIPVNDFPDIRVIPGSLRVEPAEVVSGGHNAMFYWQVEVRNSQGQRIGHDIYIREKRVHGRTVASSQRCHVQRQKWYNNTCWLPKEVGTYPVRVRVKIDGEPESMLGDNEIKGEIQILPQPER